MIISRTFEHYMDSDTAFTVYVRNRLTGKTKVRVIEGITIEQIQAYESGVFVQDAFPNLSTDDREFIISGTTPEEWEKMVEAMAEEEGAG